MKALNRVAALALAVTWGVDKADALVRYLRGRFTARSERLIQALSIATGRAWKAVEVALAGPSWWDRVKGVVTSGDEKKFRRDLEAFLQSSAADAGRLDAARRQEAVEDLRQARKSGLIPGAKLAPDELTQQAQTLAGCGTHAHLLAAEGRSLNGLIDDVRQAGYAALAEVVSLRPAGGQPLLVLAVRYFFGREVAADEELREGLTLQQLEGMSAAQEAGFRGLGDALAEHGAALDRLESLARQTHQGMREVKDEVERHGAQTQELLAALQRELHGERDRHSQERDQHRQQVQQLQEMMQAVMGLLQDRRAGAGSPDPALTSAGSVVGVGSPDPAPAAARQRPEAERRKIRTILDQASHLSQEQRQSLPAFWFALGTLEREVGAEPAAEGATPRTVNALFTMRPATDGAGPVEPPQPSAGVNPLFAKGAGQPEAPAPFEPRANPVPRFEEPAALTAESGAPATDATPAPPEEGKKRRGPRLVSRDGQGPLFRT